jgi:hypothetical protein
MTTKVRIQTGTLFPPLHERPNMLPSITKPLSPEKEHPPKEKRLVTAISAEPIQLQTLKQQLCLKILTQGFVHSFVDFFYLTHQKEKSNPKSNKGRKSPELHSTSQGKKFLYEFELRGFSSRT